MVSENEIIYLEPPKRKQLKTILSLTKNMNKDNINDQDIDNLYEAALIAFNKNKENKMFSQDTIDEILCFNAYMLSLMDIIHG